MLPIIFIILAIILSVLSCVLPYWSTNEVTVDKTNSTKYEMTNHGGLWLKCDEKLQELQSEKSQGYTCRKIGAPGIQEPGGNLTSKILSIVAPSLLLISILFVYTNHFKIIVLVSIWCLLALILAYPLLVLNNNIKDDLRNNICNQSSVTCHEGTLSVSYFLEIGAIVMAIIGIILHTGKSSSGKRKHGKRKHGKRK